MPASYLPEGVYFLLAHKDAVILPYKIRDAKVHQDPPGISGALLEGRNNYDAFVIGARCMGVYAAVTQDKVVATPSVSMSSNTATVTCTTSDAEIFYTIDGTDPRYSENAEKYASPVTVPEGQKIRVYAVKDGMFTSAVAEG